MFLITQLILRCSEIRELILHQLPATFRLGFYQPIFHPHTGEKNSNEISNVKNAKRARLKIIQIIKRHMACDEPCAGNYTYIYVYHFQLLMGAEKTLIGSI